MLRICEMPFDRHLQTVTALLGHSLGRRERRGRRKSEGERADEGIGPYKHDRKCGGRSGDERRNRRAGSEKERLELPALKRGGNGIGKFFEVRDHGARLFQRVIL